MAKEVIAYSIEADSSKAGKSLSDLKKEFKEAQKELSTLTQGSKEYIAQLEKLGTIKDDIGDLNDEIKAFNPEGKIKALGNVVGGLAGGFAAAQGAVALFGVENQELEKTLVKLQAAMAFQQGIEGITSLGDSFKVLWNIVKANPLGAILTALALVGTAVAAFVSQMDRSSEATKKLTVELEIQKKTTELLSKETSRQVELLKSQGASELEIIAVKEKLTKQQIIELETSLQLHQAKLNDIRDNNSLTESYYELLKSIQLKTGQEAAAAQSQAIIQALKLERAKEDIDAINLEKEQLKDLKNQIAILGNEKINISNKATQNYIDNLNKEKEAQVKHDAEILALWNESLYNKQQAEINAAYQTAAQKQAILDAELAAQNEAFAGAEEFKTTVKVENMEKLNALDKEGAANSLAIAQASNDGMQSLSDLYFMVKSRNLQKGSAAELRAAKQQFKINKALAITSSTIQGVQAVLAAYSSGSAIPVVGAVTGPLFAALAGVTVAANIAKIASAKFNEGGSGGSGGGASIPSPAAPSIAPPSQGSTQLNSDGTVKAAQTNNTGAIKAYVVETDITKKQKQVGSIETNAKL